MTTARVAKKSFTIIAFLARFLVRFTFKKRSMPEALMVFAFVSGGIFAVIQLLDWAAASFFGLFG